MNFRHTFFILMIASFSQHAFAFFCPNNFNQIDIGYTQQQVDELCGKPANVSETDKQAEDSGPQEWTYMIKQPAIFGSDIPGSVKATLAFDDKGKVINMTINGMSVGTGTMCGNNVQIGSTREMVKKACGNPAYVNRAQSNGPAAAPTKQTVYQYDGSPAISLTFENGVLVSKK